MTGVRVRVGALATVLAIEGALYAWLLRYDQLTTHHHAQLLAAASAPVWIAAVWLLRGLTLGRRAATWLVLGVAAVFQVIALTHAPTTSDDDFRYVWDAKVQFAGVDPYRYPPAAAALRDERDDFLFGAGGPCRHQVPGGCTSINRPGVHTIYPPVAQAAFDVIHAVAFGGGHLPLQLFGALGSLAVAGLLLRRAPPWQAALWAWCPVIVIEYGNNAHIDWLAVLLGVLALSRRRVWSAGVLVGAAIAVKIYPALLLPSLMRRSWLTAVVAVGFVALVYVPHVLAVGADVIGYLPGYLHEQKYGSGGRLLLLGAILPHPLDTVVGALIVAAVALWVWRRGDADEPQRSAVLVFGVTFLVFTPSYGWYAGLLFALVAWTGALEWVPIGYAATFAYLVHTDHDTAIYTVAALLALIVALVRHRDSLRGWLPLTSRGTDRSRSSPSTRRR